MIKEEDVFKIGRLGKPHGVKGEVTMQVDDDVFDRVDADFLVLWVDGILVPFFIEEYRFKTDTTALIKFEDVDTVEGARELTNSDVFFPRFIWKQLIEPYALKALPTTIVWLRLMWEMNTRNYANAAAGSTN